MNILTATLAAALLVQLARPAAAAAIFSQDSPNGNSFDITDYRLADDFSLPGASVVDGIDFWYQAQFQTDLSVVTYAIYANQAGALGTLLQSETINTITTSCCDASSGLFLANFSITTVSLPAGSYWLELHAGSTLIDTSGFLVSWGAAPDNATAIALNNQSLNQPDTPVNVSGFNQYAFDINGTAAPEPATAALAVLGLCGLALWRRRREMSLAPSAGTPRTDHSGRTS